MMKKTMDKKNARKSNNRTNTFWKWVKRAKHGVSS